MPFPRSLAQSETQIYLSRISNRVTDSTSYDDDQYTMLASWMKKKALVGCISIPVVVVHLKPKS